MLTAVLFSREEAAKTRILIRKLLLVNEVISFLSSFVSIPIFRLHLPPNYSLFLPCSYPLGLSYSVSPELIYPRSITWYVWLFLPRDFYPSPAFQFTLKLERAEVLLIETFFFFVFLVINTIVSVSVLLLLRRSKEAKNQTNLSRGDT